MSISRSVLPFTFVVFAQTSLLAQPLSPNLDLMSQAQKAEKSGDLALAEKSYEALLEKKTNLQEYAHYYLGQMQQKSGRLSDAKTHFQKVLELSPNVKLQLDSQFQLAQIFISEKSYAKARSHLMTLEKRSRREHQYVDIIYALAKVERGLNNQGPFCKWARKIYSHYPEFPAVHDWGLHLSENIFEGAKTKCSASAEDHRLRIKNLQWAGMSEEAHKEIDLLKGTGIFEAAEIEKLEVQYNLHEGEVTKALDVLLAHYEERKTNFGYLMTLGTAAARAGEMQAAVGSYYQAYKMGGRSKLAKQALYQSAFMSYQFQDYDGAYRRFQEFMKVFPTSGLSRDAKWHLAWIRYLRGDYEGAFKSLEDLRQVPRRGKKQAASTDRVNYWMGMSLLKQKKYEEARAMFEGLAKDQLLGYYAIASQYRIRKLDSILPKKIKKGAGEATRRLSRFSMSETLMASDDSGFSPVSEEAESEETLAASALAQEGRETEVAEEAPAEELNGERPPGVADNSEESEVKTSFSNPVLVKRFERARDLMILGLNDWAKWDLYDIERKTTNKEYLKTLMTEYETVDNYNRSSYIGQISFGSQRAAYGMEGVRYLWEHTYPRAYAPHVTKYAKRFEIPQELIWGIMRAESQYKKDVVSPVGALGLMQVMPNTGQKISLMIGEKDFKAEDLLQPEPAIKIGARYLARLMKKFEGSVPLVAAGYNAGPHRVKNWLASFGELDVDEFIEHIPFLETRNYVKRVVSNFYVYNQLYNSKKDNLTPLSESNRVRVNEPLSSRETWEDN